MTDELELLPERPPEQDCGCDSKPAGNTTSTDGSVPPHLEPSWPHHTRRGFLAKLAVLPVVAALTRFLPIGGGQGASAATCYSWTYVGCEKYCDCRCAEVNKYYVYKRLCCSGGCWYEYTYNGFSYCGNWCAPCSAYLGTC